MPFYSNPHFIAIRLGEKHYGIPIALVQEVMSSTKISKIPLARSDLKGFFNLRGHIVPALDLKACLHGKTGLGDVDNKMLLVIRISHEIYGLLVDAVGGIVPIVADNDTPWSFLADAQPYSPGCYRRGEECLIELDIAALLRDHGIKQDMAS